MVRLVAALLDRFFQAGKKGDARLTALHMLFQLFTYRFVQFAIEVIREFGEHFLAPALARLRG